MTNNPCPDDGVDSVGTDERLGVFLPGVCDCGHTVWIDSHVTDSGGAPNIDVQLATGFQQHRL